MNQLDDSRQAGTQVDVIITSEMISAAASALRLAANGAEPCDGGLEAAHDALLAGLSASSVLRVAG